MTGAERYLKSEADDEECVATYVYVYDDKYKNKREKLCTIVAKNGGVCVKHGAKVKRCSEEGCPNQAVKEGICKRHGAKVRLCNKEGCKNQAQKGGVCIRHGAKVKPPKNVVRLNAQIKLELEEFA